MNKQLILFTLICLLFQACHSSFKKEDFLSETVKENENFRIKIRAFKQRAEIGADGVEYQFQTRDLNDTDWREIMVVHHDDGVKLDENNMILVSPTAGFAFVSDKYAVTVNRGKSWKTLRLINQDPTCMINKVELESDGKGTLTLSFGKELKKLRTMNFGLEFDE